MKQRLIKASKKSQLINDKVQIKKLLEIEIAGRYYLQEGKIKNRLSGDPDVERAIEILHDKTLYSSILSGQPIK